DLLIGVFDEARQRFRDDLLRRREPARANGGIDELLVLRVQRDLDRSRHRGLLLCFILSYVSRLRPCSSLPVVEVDATLAGWPYDAAMRAVRRRLPGLLTVLSLLLCVTLGALWLRSHFARD